jgi:NAD(P)-dependent dehydrogenase (short-subunit alcohol dehydrogenase family)
MARKVWFITGASRGLGLAIARAVLEKGVAVVAAARNPNRAEEVLGPSDRVLAVSIDVTDRASIQRAADAAVARFGSDPDGIPIEVYSADRANSALEENARVGSTTGTPELCRL